MRLAALAVLVLGILALAAAGCGGGEETSPTPETVRGTTETGTTGTQAGGKTGTGGGGEVKGDAAAGKAIFDDQGCGGCHTLADAGTSGSIGPDLDDLKPSYDAVVQQVTDGGGGMPAFKDQLSEKQIQDVSAYVFTSTHG
jgi:mono/diheme cytochrome c family protein